jgi:hypothetical protein
MTQADAIKGEKAGVVHRKVYLLSKLQIRFAAVGRGQ